MAEAKVALTVNPKLAAAMQQAGERVEAGGKAYVGAVALEILWRLSRRTPVRTGRARGNWRVGLGVMDPAYDPEGYDPAGDQVMARGRRVLEGMSLGQTVVLSNTTPYIGPLEHGYSRKAPQGMVMVTAAEVPMIAREKARDLQAAMHGRQAVLDSFLGR